jgi:hypothetical protein
MTGEKGISNLRFQKGNAARRAAGKRVIGGALAVLIGVGCAHRAEQAPGGERVVGYRGPTEPMRQVVGEINENNKAVPSLWARHYFEGNIVDDRGKSHFVNADGVLLMLKPGEVRLVANKEFAGRIFDLGTDGERFWMSVPVEVDTMWWGFNRNIGRPCARGIPIQPQGILEVLGVGEFDANLNQPPVPVMRFNPDNDSYMFVWSRPLSDRWAATKEVWYDRATKRPKMVLLFDENGRVVLRAYLYDHQQVEVAGRAREQWPWVAARYRLFFPDSGSKITLTLRDMQIQTEEGIPDDRSFRMPDPKKAGVSKVVQIDEECGQ